ncbi:unnamed protein product [Rhizoctonia solani]|uniref:Uncharacterized protein n=1 Tax=Rhizoctonia solani TaxID=456999 RepID=A0A8H2WFL2_9AGAM|nr:unnamed protein product [Rhizoctonia solani]
MGNDALEQSCVVVSNEPIELIGDPDSILPEIPHIVLSQTTQHACFGVIEQFLQPSRPSMICEYQREIADKKFVGSTAAGHVFEESLKGARTIIGCALDHIHGVPLRSPTSSFSRASALRRRPKVSELKNELIQTRQRLHELQDAYITLENNCAEQTARLEEFSSEIYTENARLRTELDTLQTTLDELQPKSAQNQVHTQDQIIQTVPAPEEKPTRGDLQAEVLSLKAQLAEAKLAEASSIKEVAKLSEELSKIKSPLAETQRANSELTKRVASLEKQAENKAKALDTKGEEANKVKADAAKVSGQLKSTKDELEKVQRQLKECIAGRTKLEEERTKAINVAESMLKGKEILEKELNAAKAQVEAVKKQFKAEVSRLQESIVEKESRVGQIAKAAEVWALASTEAKALKEEIKLLQTCADARQREAHHELFELRTEYEVASKEWELERIRLDASILSLTQAGEKTKDDLAKAIIQNDAESQSYMKRIDELRQWGEQRWDVMGNDCIIV